MKAELILKSDVLDILFENRNKAYGAYNLRKFYNNRVKKSLVIMFGFVVLISTLALIPSKKIPIVDTIDEVYFGKPLPIVKPDIPVKKQVAVSATKPVKTQIYSTHILITKRQDISELKNLTDETNIGSTNSNVNGTGIVLVNEPLAEESVTGKENAPIAKVEKHDEPAAPTFSPEVMPSFPGGMEALKKFLQKNLTNPKDLEDGELISVKVQFVVGFDGKLQSFNVIEDGGEVFNKEVIRVLKKMPEWIPGKTRGQNVSVYYTIPVKFVAAN